MTIKIQERTGVFETNSSSSHSLTISANALRPDTLVSKATAERGMVYAHLGEYGWEYYRYYTLEGKLSYLATQQLAYMQDMCKEITDFSDMPNTVQMLETAVKNLTGCNLTIVANGSYYIDHESVGTGSELFSSQEKLENFLADSNSFIETGNDNSSAPWTINSDVGTIEYYAEFYKEIPSPYKKIKLNVDFDEVRILVTEAGFVINACSTADLHARLHREGVVTHFESIKGPELTQYSSSSDMAEEVNDLIQLISLSDYPESPNGKNTMGISSSLTFSKKTDPTLKDSWETRTCIEVAVPEDLFEKLSVVPTESYHAQLLEVYKASKAELIAEYNSLVASTGPGKEDYSVKHTKNRIDKLTEKIEKATQ